MSELKAMMARHRQAGQVAWIGLRPARREDMVARDGVTLDGDGIVGDHGRPGKRAVTLLQAEHLGVIAALLGQEVTAEELRRNILVSGINLSAMRGARVQIGEAVLELTGPCHPCSRMEEALGPGGYSAVRGHGGMCATVIVPGRVALGDAVTPV